MKRRPLKRVPLKRVPLKRVPWRVMFGFQACPAPPVVAGTNLYRLIGPEQRLCD
jgi:hypothetical protein